MLLCCAAVLLMLLTFFILMLLTMQGAIGAFFSRAGVVKTTLFQHVRVLNPALRPLIVSRAESVSFVAHIEEHNIEHSKMTQHNVGALVVAKPGEQKSIAGIITERGIPDFAVVYSFIGSVFDPDTKGHVRKLKEMDPIIYQT
ncbi:hypothetical protein LINPERHAP2_LOCUS23272, partial [Linum perenne]